MKSTTNGDYPQRVLDALNGMPSARRSALLKEHEHAYRLAAMTGAGYIRPDGLTDDGAAKLAALGAAVEVQPGEVAAPAGHAKK
jgi:hypothetical protein